LRSGTQGPVVDAAFLKANMEALMDSARFAVDKMDGAETLVVEALRGLHTVSDVEAKMEAVFEEVAMRFQEETDRMEYITLAVYHSKSFAPMHYCHRTVDLMDAMDNQSDLEGETLLAFTQDLACIADMFKGADQIRTTDMDSNYTGVEAVKLSGRIRASMYVIKENAKAIVDAGRVLLGEIRDRQTLGNKVDKKTLEKLARLIRKIH